MAWESHVDALIAAFICAVWRAKKGEVAQRGGTPAGWLGAGWRIASKVLLRFFLIEGLFCYFFTACRTNASNDTSSALAATGTSCPFLKPMFASTGMGSVSTVSAKPSSSR